MRAPQRLQHQTAQYIAVHELKLIYMGSPVHLDMAVLKADVIKTGVLNSFCIARSQYIQMSWG
jgi:hypothetical protein